MLNFRVMRAGRLGGLPVVMTTCFLAVSCAALDRGDTDLAVSPSEARAAIQGMFVGSGRLRYVEEELTAACMGKKGFSYKVFPQRPDRVLRVDYANDVDTARRVGYGLAQDAALTADLLRAEESAGGQGGAAYHEALYGPPNSPLVRVRSAGGDEVEMSSAGCKANAQKELYGSVSKALVFSEFQANTIYSVLFHSRQKDSAVQDAFEDWKTCMAGRGYPFKYRNSGWGTVKTAYVENPSTAKATEFKTAIDDAECDVESGYTRAARPVEDLALAKLITEHEAEITALQEIRRTAVSNAQNRH